MYRILLLLSLPVACFADITVKQDEEAVYLETGAVKAAVRKTGYVSGVYRQSFVDKKSSFRDAGFGLDIADWLMEPGSDAAYRDRLDPELVDEFHACGMSRAEDLVDRFARPFFFGCEADEPYAGAALRGEGMPFGTPIQALFSSDIGHWDVADARARQRSPEEDEPEDGRVR